MLEPHSGCTAPWLFQFSAGHVVAPSQLFKRHKTNKQIPRRHHSSLIPTANQRNSNSSIREERKGEKRRKGLERMKWGAEMAGKDSTLLSQRNKRNIDNGTWSYTVAVSVY